MYKHYRVGRGRLTLAESSVSVQEAFVLVMNPWSNQTGFFTGFRKREERLWWRLKRSIHSLKGILTAWKMVDGGLGLFELVPEELLISLLFVFDVHWTH